jgi:cytochrome c-type biogenesis protein
MLLDVSYFGAFITGLFSFLLPCILPIVPFYLAYLAGITMNQFTDDGTLNDGSRRRVILASIFFAAGIITIFAGLGAAATAFGQALRQYSDILSYVAGTLIVILGLHFTGLVRIPLLYREARFEVNDRPSSLLGSYVIGLAFAFGWTPCAGPILAVILMTAASLDTVAQGSMLLIAYGIGMTLPFVLAAVFASTFMKFFARFRKHLGRIEKIAGAFLIVFGLLILTGQVNRIAQWLLLTFPNYTAAVTG